MTTATQERTGTRPLILAMLFFAFGQFVSPIFSASYSGLFKMFFDVLQPQSLAGKPTLIAATAGTARHSLALEHAVRPLFAYLRTLVVPTAVFAASDQMALAVLEVAQQLGIDVPTDLSLVGFDNIPESALSEPPLTTVAQPIREMGRAAVTLLIDLIEGREPGDLHRTLGTDLVLRRSTQTPGGIPS